ncbi:MAG: Cof-type HAD-IIB family hydrolase [Oscillospiraceae bacterium]|nr:Cof-type HAD-IIB family hydrolase [Oscillospiraceae bacterium]
MIRLIVSDIDGTLLHGTQSELNPQLFSLIQALNQRGILFAPASGRQYHSLRRLFAPAEDRLCFLCENGAEIYGPSATEEDAVPLFRSQISRDICDPLIDHILASPNRSALISCCNLSYLICRHDAFLERIANFTGNRYVVVQDKSQIPDPIIKLAAYCENGSDRTDAEMGEVWRSRGLTVSQAGREWLDFTLANKGTGLQELCRVWNIPPSEVMAFGDNYNDKAMLDLAGHPVIMDNAVPALRALYPHHCFRVEAYLSAFISSL